MTAGEKMLLRALGSRVVGRKRRAYLIEVVPGATVEIARSDLSAWLERRWNTRQRHKNKPVSGCGGYGVSRAWAMRGGIEP